MPKRSPSRLTNPLNESISVLRPCSMSVGIDPLIWPKPRGGGPPNRRPTRRPLARPHRLPGCDQLQSHSPARCDGLGHGPPQPPSEPQAKLTRRGPGCSRQSRALPPSTELTGLLMPVHHQLRPDGPPDVVADRQRRYLAPKSWPPAPSRAVRAPSISPICSVGLQSTRT